MQSVLLALQLVPMCMHAQGGEAGGRQRKEEEGMCQQPPGSLLGLGISALPGFILH